MNIKQFAIILIIASLFGIYYGSDYLRLRGHLVETLQNEPFTKKNVGQFLDITVSKSQDAPYCQAEACKDTKRYHIIMKGDVATLQLSTDYNRKTNQFSHRLYCNEKGEIVEMGEGIRNFICR